jgi:hypothetical protein
MKETMSMSCGNPLDKEGYQIVNILPPISLIKKIRSTVYFKKKTQKAK